MADDNNIFADEDDYKEYNSLLKKNATKAQILNSQGIGLDGSSMMQARLELLIEIALPQDDRRRLTFELLWQRKIKESLEEADRQISRAILTAPLPGPPGGGKVIQIPRA